MSLAASVLPAARLLAPVLALLLQQTPATRAPGDVPVQMGVTTRPDTVTVGDHFLVTIRVRAPRGATIIFPAGPPPDSGVIESVDSRDVRAAADSSAVDQSAIYRLVAWDTGRVAAPIGPVNVRVAGISRVVPLDSIRVYVRSVLPADTSLHVPKPARDIFAGTRPWWHWLLAALLAAVIIGLLLWWWIRRRRRRPAVITVVDPFAHAEEEFARIEALRLIEAGERGRYVALTVEVLREYLAGRIPAARASHTSSELLGALHGTRDVPLERLGALLTETDLVKFARRPITAERAREVGTETRVIVQRVEENIVEAARAAAAQAAAQAPAKEAA